MATTTMLPSVEAHSRATVESLFDFIIAQGDADYIGEPVSQLQHSLQAAHLARNAHADDDTVLGALLHDIGRFIPQADTMPAMIAADGTYVGRESHEHVGEKYLRQLGFSEKICQLVGAHVMAKRYLCAVDKTYWDGLSQSSKTTLKYQGGPFDEAQVKTAQADPWLENKLQVRKWDDLAKDPNWKAAPLSDYQQMAVKSLTISRQSVTVHGRTYQVPRQPTVAICVDGFDPEYLEDGVKHGYLPNLSKIVSNGFHVTAKSAMPSLTNPNNVSIVTGMPPSVHGVLGNFFLDRETGKEVIMVDDALLIGPTILSEMSSHSVRVAAITAKDKLRRILVHGLNPSTSICFSAEKADQCAIHMDNKPVNAEEWMAQKAPPQYSGALSLYVLDAGIKLLQSQSSDLLYLTLSDFIQHKHAPGSKEANAFMTALDSRVGSLISLGAIVGLTGDHGMSAKTRLSDSKPNILFIQDVLESHFGPGSARVICPITDPFPRHHGGLGSFVRVYARDSAQIPAMIEYLNTQLSSTYDDNAPSLYGVYTRSEAVEKFQCGPYEREGDIIVVSAKNTVLGACASEHDLSNVQDEKLRSHGGVSEMGIPLLMNVAADTQQNEGRQRQWRNFDIFDLLLNYGNKG